MPAIRCISGVDVQEWEPTSNDAKAKLTSDNIYPFFDVSGFNMHATALSSIGQRRQAPLSPMPSVLSSLPAFSKPCVIQDQTTCTDRISSTFQPSLRNTVAAGRGTRAARSSTERKIARKLAENADYIPRPKNSFILFRTDFVTRRTSNSNGSEGGEDDEMGVSLSKLASEVWNKMSAVEKQPWVERADREKLEHAAKYPNYRYRPVRQRSHRRPSPEDGKWTRQTQESASPEAASTLAVRNGGLDDAMIQDILNWGSHSASPSTASLRSKNLSAEAGFDSTPNTILADAELQMPTPVRSLSQLHERSSVTDAMSTLMLSPPLAKSVSVPVPPSVPPVPRLNFSVPTRMRAAELPSIPRSPSAPVFDTSATFESSRYRPQPHAHYPVPVRYPQSIPFITRPTSCPPTPIPQPITPSSTPQEQTETYAYLFPEGLDAPGLAPFSSAQTLSTHGLSALGYFTAEDDYASVLPGSGEDNGAHGFVAPAGPEPLVTYPDDSMVMIGSEYLQGYDTNLDIGMSMLSPPVAEQSGQTTIPPADVFSQQQPLDAISALWIQGQTSVGAISDSQIDANLGTDPVQSMDATSVFAQQKPDDSSRMQIETYSNAFEGMYTSEPGLVTYKRLLESVQLFPDDAPDGHAYHLQCTPCLSHPDLDLDFELSCSTVLPESALSFTALGEISRTDVLEPDCNYDRNDGIHGYDDYGYYAQGRY